MSSVEALEEQVRALQARLTAVEDVESIRRLKARYAELVDRRYSRGTSRRSSRRNGLGRCAGNRRPGRGRRRPGCHPGRLQRSRADERQFLSLSGGASIATFQC